MADTTIPIYENVYYHKVKTSEKSPSSNKIKETREKVDELVEILHENVGKAMEREHKLSDLNEISEILEKGASEFKTQGETIKRKEWWKHMKTKLVFAGLIAVLLIIVILLLIQTFTMK